MPSILTAWLRLSRFRDWCTSKVTFTGACIGLLVPAESSALELMAMIGTIAAWGAFGYGINEIADRGADQRAGKVNRAAGLSAASWTLFLLLTAASSMALSLIWAPDAAVPLFVAGGLVLSTAYSAPPIRLKERGVLGLASAAAAQWVLPVLAIAAAEPRGWLRPATWSMALLGLAIGLRWIAVHQLHDTSVDRQSGVRTYASTGGRVWSLILGAFLAEVGLLSATLILTWPESVPAIAALALGLVHEFSLAESFRSRLQSYQRAPLREYYFLLLPVSLALVRGLRHPDFLVLAVVCVILGWGYVLAMFRDWRERLAPA
ncbi:MAG: hypothetical protein ACRD44_11230 [Bryobacteraceae bacterium]